jgi:hypothetical protein
MPSNAYARAGMLMRGLLTRRLQSRLSGISPSCGSPGRACHRSAQVAGELSRIDSFLLNVLADSAEHRRSDSTDDIACLFTADPGNVAHPLRYGIVMIAEDLMKRCGLLRIFRLRGGLTMDGVRAARIRMRRYCGGY